MNPTTKTSLLDNLQVNKNKGSVEACKRCSGYACCGQIKKGGSIEPPFLTKTDIVNIEYYSGLKKEQFSDIRINPITNNTINIMKATHDNGCTFFNKSSGKCQIHSFRPMDCRLFPLDVELKNGIYFWALFNIKTCSLSKKDLQSLLKYKSDALDILGKDLHDYATMPVPGMSAIGYTTLMQIER